MISITTRHHGVYPSITYAPKHGVAKTAIEYNRTYR